MAGKRKKASDAYFEDEIDLTPYINRVVKRKWWIIIAIVIFASAGYGLSYLMPKKYQINAAITFSGYRRIDTGEESVIESPLIGCAYVPDIVSKFESYLRENGDAEGFYSVSAEGKAYPLPLRIIVGEGVEAKRFADELLEYMNTNNYVAGEIDTLRRSLTGQIQEYTSSLENIENEISGIETQLAGAGSGNADLLSTYAELVSLKKDLRKEKLELQQILDSLSGFKYSVSPYIASNGNPVSPNKMQNGLIAGFLVGMLGVGVAAFKKKD